MKRGFTYKQVIEYVREHYNYTVQTCIIAMILREMGYDVRRAPNSGTAANPKAPTDRDRESVPDAVHFLTSK